MLLNVLRKNKFIYSWLGPVWKKYKKRKYTNTKYRFIDRRKKTDTLIYILAGYKSFVYETVFERIRKFAPEDADICIVSSGLFSDELNEIAEKNNWSYLSTSKNSVTMVQNVVLRVFEDAKFIYKLDEDVFVTEHFFETLKETYQYVQEQGEYNVGFVAPLIPINGYGNYKILEKLNQLQYFEERFQKPRYEAGMHRMIENSPEVARFMWGEGNVIPSIDEMDEMFHVEPMRYGACPIRFSIGAIYFERKLWEDMGMFRAYGGPDMGLDEEQICCFCMLNSRAMIVSENTVVGHLSFGTQNLPMKEYYTDTLKERLSL